ncbi:hypothetical protein ABFT23_05295 [Nocardioides sp. C4-1]|uniref:hypothetical protein n=1 Tax=Nocardioides sp. C4-1 TaxID=3151851 RepID=UPI003262EE3C
MTVRARSLVAPLAVVAVVGVALLARGHDADPPAGAGGPPAAVVTTDEFCAGFDDLADAQDAHLSAASPQTVSDLRASADRVVDLAADTAEMSDDARAGVAYVARVFLGLADDASAQDLVESGGTATVADERHADALAEFVTANCVRGLSDAK